MRQDQFERLQILSEKLLDVFIDEGKVVVGVPRLFTKPLRLTAPEAFALLTAAEAASKGATP